MSETYFGIVVGKMRRLVVCGCCMVVLSPWDRPGFILDLFTLSWRYRQRETVAEDFTHETHRSKCGRDDWPVINQYIPQAL